MDSSASLPAYAEPPESSGPSGSGAAPPAERTAGPAGFVPSSLTSAAGTLSANVFFLIASIAMLMFLPWVVPTMTALLEDRSVVLWVFLVLAIVLPLPIGIAALVGMYRSGHLGPRARRPPAGPRSSRTVPVVRFATALAYLQWASFLALFLGLCAEVVVRDGAWSLPRAFTPVLTVWTIVQIALALAVHRSTHRRVALAAVLGVAALVHLLAVDASLRERMLGLADTALMVSLVYTALRYLQNLSRAASAMQGDHTRRHLESTALEAAVSEAGRIEDLIHDNILSCLLLTSRGGAEDEWAAGQIKQHAATALSTLDEIAHPTPAPSLTPLHPDRFARNLETQIAALSPEVSVHARVWRRRPIPAEVDHALTSATLEAVRNSLRHAEGSLRHEHDAVHRRVVVEVLDSAVSIEVVDDGQGFDPVKVPPRSMGLRASILRRVQQLPGGHAGVASAPDQGTSVQMSWTDTAAERNSASGAAPSGLQRLTAWAARAPGPEGVADETSVRDARPRVRVLVLLGLSLLTMLLSLPTHEPPWPSVLAFVLMAACALALTRSGGESTAAEHPPPWMRPLFGLVPVVMTALTLGSWNGEGLRDIELWTTTGGIALLVLLALSRYAFAAWTGALGTAAVFVVWSVTTGQPDAPWSGGWFALIVVVGMCALLGRWATRQFDAVADLSRGREDSIAQSVGRAEALRQRRIRSQELEQVVRPLMTKLASDEPVTPEMELEAGLLEARLRDDIRAKAFHGTAVARSAWEARARGVVVEIMDDGGLDHASNALTQAVVGVVAKRIDQALDGQITIRVLPADREVVVSVLHRPASGFHVRTELYEDGHVRTVTT